MARNFIPKTIEQQMELIQGRMKENNTGDFARLKKYLENHGYDEVIYPFETFLYKNADATNKEFRDGIKVQQIINLFNMSAEITSEILNAILYVEKTMKTVLKSNISSALIKLNKKLTVRNSNNFKKEGNGVKFIKQKPIILELDEKELKLLTRYSIPKTAQITYFDIVNAMSFSELVDVYSDHHEFNSLQKDIYNKLNIRPKTNIKKFVETMKYFGMIRNTLAHGGAIIGKGLPKKYVNSRDIFFYQTKNHKRTKTNYYPISDFLYIYRIISEKRFGKLVAKISQIYYRYAFSGEDIIFDQKELFGFKPIDFANK